MLHKHTHTYTLKLFSFLALLELASHIAVVGGGAMLPGFKGQLLTELRSLCSSPRYSALHGYTSLY